MWREGTVSFLIIEIKSLSGNKSLSGRGCQLWAVGLVFLEILNWVTVVQRKSHPRKTGMIHKSFRRLPLLGLGPDFLLSCRVGSGNSQRCNSLLCLVVGRRSPSSASGAALNCSVLDSPPVLFSTGEATAWVLCPILGLSVQKGRWGAGANPERGSKAGEQSCAQVRWGAAEVAGGV